MNKRTTKMTMVVLMLLAVSLYFVSGTYARYSSTFEGEGTVEIADWVVLLDGKTPEATTTLNLEFEVEENEYVVPGKIAPGVTATADLVLNLTGTEVAVDVEAVLGAIDKEVLGVSANDVVVTVETSNGSNTVELEDDAAFTEDNGLVTVTIKVVWTNNDTHNVTDTAAAGKTLTIPVTVTAKQHIK